MNLMDKITSRQATIAVVGLGYVGLPLAVAFAEAGFQLIGVDVDENKVAALNRGESYVEDVPSSIIDRLSRIGPAAGGLSATSDFEVLEEADAAIICVPTPLNKTKDPDLSFIVAAADEVQRHLHSEMLIVLESTSYPGTTTEIVLPRLERGNGRACKVGRDFYLAFSPERIDPGRKDWTVEKTPKVIGGATPRCLEMAQALYSTAIEHVVPVSSTETAEMVKLLENTFRAVNIGLVNEIAIMCDRLGLDVWEVIEAAKTKPYGYMPFYPGPGLGGHCIPIDPEYLAWKLKTLNYRARFIELAEEINFGMPEFVLDKIQDALNDERKAIKGSRILVLGAAYKENIGDLRESPAIDLLRLLCAKGADVAYHDPYVPSLRADDLVLKSISLSEAALRSFDCVVVVTAHSSFDWQWIADHSRLVVDTRNATRNVTAHEARIVKL